jgi:hypothetical protein
MVRLGPGIGDELATSIRATVDPSVVGFTDDFAHASFVLDASGTDHFTVVPIGDAARPEAAPAVTDAAGTALRTILRGAERDGTVRAIADTLDFVVRTQRFWALLGDAHDVDAQIRLADGGGLAVSADGTPTCTDGTRVTITMTNRAREPRRLGLFQSEAPDGVLGGFELVYQSPTRIEPGASVTLTGPMSLSAEGSAREVLRLKVVSTTLDRITLPAELAEPDSVARTRSAGTDPDPFAAMFGHAQSGTRAAAPALGWASQNLTLEIRPRGIRND